MADGFAVTDGSAGRSAPGAPLDLRSLRRDYTLGRLEDDPAAGDWTGLFGPWFDAARADPAVIEPNAIQLATADATGRPSVRTVLAKTVGARGLVFYTHHDSAKGRDLALTPWSAAVFAWLPHQRQVRFAGPTAQVGRDETEEYFAQRPRGSQIGAWASPQSRVVSGRGELDAAVATTEHRFAGVDVIPAPPDWGGYLLRPVEVEFWQGRENRMHDRIRFHRDDADAGTWRIDRLAP